MGNLYGSYGNKYLSRGNSLTKQGRTAEASIWYKASKSHWKSANRYYGKAK